MINHLTGRKALVCLTLFIGLSEVSPAIAKNTGSSSTTATTSSPSKANKSPMKPSTTRYCITESISSRIPRTYCKTAEEWMHDQVNVNEPD